MLNDTILIKYTNDTKLYPAEYGRETIAKLLDSKMVICVYVYNMGKFVPRYSKEFLKNDGGSR